jgi:UDP-3-O-[3-hydroxymyristoyl] glucosamine N-acyltransferase
VRWYACIEDDVEIGPLATVDAGTLAPTIVRRGTRIDAHVHVGHNARVGPNAMIAAQSGFAGSVEIGAEVRIGGQAGIADHVHIGAGAQIAAKSGVIGDVEAGNIVAGYPAVDRHRWLRGMARLLRRGDKRK